MMKRGTANEHERERKKIKCKNYVAICVITKHMVSISSPSPRREFGSKKGEQMTEKKVRYTRTVFPSGARARQMLPHFDEANENCHGLKALLLQRVNFFR